ncbi:RNA polymerase II elongation factor Ell-like [Polistes fuscatus]|uniref:RNA polymerase II elongation factor Ell-like n=1 Tax=Polistes fuscatus TaxID=30207 RepID=UPI001CA8CBE5|nr:RNA polymerase II elongation factor Ell-like [Polistes fuscatus]
MAALVAGVQYGLSSSQNNLPENKSLIFVKLTDSAQRAIEDFLRNENKTSQNPTIQFLGNEGQLSFPSTQSSHGSAGFTFSLSGNQDIEGPQGGFECIQQTGPTSLESLGALPYKMRIQANDDVYETTRHRMAVAEENNKNKCTRVIKANGPDIGRKVKVKSTVHKTVPPVSNNARYRESSNVPPSSTGGNQSRVSCTYKMTPVNNHPIVRNQPEKKISDIMRRPLKERLIHLLALRPYKKPELYDRINKEGIKDRERSSVTTILKQVAFMRDNTFHLQRYFWNEVQEDWPYYTDQDKAMLKRRKPQNLTPPGSSDGGSSGSGQSPNSVHPGSPPAITAPPPNLLNKMPGYYQGNDGLPTKKPRISHYKKPEPSSNASSSLSSTSSKANESGRTTGSGVSGGVAVGIGGGGGGGGVGSGSGSGSGGGGSASVSTSGNASLYDVWDQRQQQQQQHHQQRERRTDYRAERTSNSEVLRSGGNYGNGKTCPMAASNSSGANNQSDAGISSSESNAANVNIVSHNSHNSITHSNSMCNNRNHHGAGGGGGGGGGGGASGQNINKSIPGSNENSIGSSVDHLARNVTNSTSSVAVGGVSAGAGGGSNSTSGGYSATSNGIINERRDRNDRIRSDRERESRQRNSASHSSTSLSSSITDHNLVYPSDLTSAQLNDNTDDNIVTTSTYIVNSPESRNLPNNNLSYLVDYTTICSLEQRRKYRTDFNQDYEEYKKLHAEVEIVSERFQQLEDRLKEEQATGNIERWKEISKIILMEYVQTKRDPIQQQKKRRFLYLHEKLSHIKRLVAEYDSRNSSSGSMLITSRMPNHNMGDTGEMDSTHY